RLRAKLRTAGLDGLVESCANGAYRFAEEILRPEVSGVGEDLPATHRGLDAPPRLRKEAANPMEQDQSLCAS
ncbi:MAG: hypothetical protein O9272_00330, partial [Brevundimonas sp.]|nr:hypothetical protein [Brevundimonas sp.]